MSNIRRLRTTFGGTPLFNMMELGTPKRRVAKNSNPQPSALSSLEYSPKYERGEVPYRAKLKEKTRGEYFKEKHGLTKERVKERYGKAKNVIKGIKTRESLTKPIGRKVGKKVRVSSPKFRRFKYSNNPFGERVVGLEF